MNETPNPIQEKFEAAVAERKNVGEANRIPFPGPLAEAFAVVQDIEVGGYRVRPFYDGDFDVLQSFNHPICKLAMGEGQYGSVIADFRGENARVLAYMLTEPVEEIERMADAQELNLIRQKSNTKFRRMQLPAMVAILNAAFEQFSRYFSTVVAYEAEDGSKKKPS